jgi:hypothetical protein
MAFRRPRTGRLPAPGGLSAEIGQAEGRDPDALAKDVATFADAHLVVAVVLSPKPSEKIPLWEQEMSAGAACLSLVNACLAAGWGAGWLTGWRARHADFCDRGLDLRDRMNPWRASSISAPRPGRRPNARARTWTRSSPGCPNDPRRFPQGAGADHRRPLPGCAGDRPWPDHRACWSGSTWSS